ncbi:MAG: hypothetical protein PF447_12140 [Spirochaetaceae bacterium]|jgi:hypothetical protein|nr:hypothetical protein [Spirochaetaceae bacterium]
MNYRPLLFLFFTFLYPLHADDIQVPAGDYRINIPVGWTIYDKEDLSNISYLSDDLSCMLQISYYSGDRFNSTDEMYEQLLAELNPQGEISLFPYLEWDAWMSDMEFQISGQPYRGWFLLLDGLEMDYQVMVFTTSVDYDVNFPWIISALDAFSPGEDANRHPGPVSTLMAQGESGVDQSTQVIGNNSFSFVFPLSQKNISQDLIEREAILLQQYAVNEPLFRLAWERYYNLIYRQNYSFLQDLYRSLEPIKDFLGEENFIKEVLKWLQDFEYSSSNTFSDLLSPITAAVEGRGDCDSLSLIYLMILDYFDIPGVLIVSEEYSHAMAAVEYNFPGASLNYNDKKYVVAELTDKVEIGQIPSSMADLDKWQIISFE